MDGSRNGGLELLVAIIPPLSIFVEASNHQPDLEPAGVAEWEGCAEIGYELEFESVLFLKPLRA